MNNNIQTGQNAMPMKGQSSSNGGEFALMRSVYQHAPKIHPENNTEHEKRGKNALYQDNSLYLIKKKAQALGKQSYSSPLSFNGNPTNDVKNAIKRTRSSGAVAPPKKSLV
jgi:hypothetical protein